MNRYLFIALFFTSKFPFVFCKKILPIFHEGLENYFKQDWDKAIEAFKTADELEEMFPGRKTNPSRIYIPRCQNFKANPPGDDWDGVWTQTSK